jgi:hypothetical protein
MRRRSNLRGSTATTSTALDEAGKADRRRASCRIALTAGGCGEDTQSHRAENEVAEQEFREGWNHAAEEEQREREENPSGESKWEELNK